MIMNSFINFCDRFCDALGDKFYLMGFLADTLLFTLIVIMFGYVALLLGRDVEFVCQRSKKILFVCMFVCFLINLK